MNKWKNSKITEGWLEYISKMRKASEYPLPEFNGTTKGEAVDYINMYLKEEDENK